jgi:DNA-3-methyladenine glycosylase II
MSGLIETIGPCTMARFPGDPFTLLVRCVIYQQISTKAARSIFEKLTTAVGAPTIPLARLESMTGEEFKVVGISGPKQRTLRAIIEHVKANPDLLPGLADMENEEIHDKLTEIKGVGPWTADMYLMFGIARPDVLPVGDYGVRVGIKKQFRLRKLPDPKKCLKIGEAWRPYRSVASWYLWQSLNLKPEKE